MDETIHAVIPSTARVANFCLQLCLGLLCYISITHPSILFYCFLSCQMDSMESVPSSVINSALKGYDKTSLPEVHDNEITQALMPGQRPPYLLNHAILVSPPSYDESYAQATYHDLQTRPFLDPNQEIHGMCWWIKYAQLIHFLSFHILGM